MDRYEKVQKPRNESPIKENEIRITTQGRLRNYITYATNLLLQRKIAGLHQITSIGSTDITDTWEPVEEGLLPLETTRHVSVITIILSKKVLDTSSIGYQPPIPANQVRPLTEYDYGGEGRLNNDGGLGYGGDAGWKGGRGYNGRGRTGGRGGGYRGRGNNYGGVAGSMPIQGQGRGQGQGQVQGRGRGRGQGQGQGIKSNGPARASVAYV
ncbi:glycine-rich cell wall structural protein 2-like isoform X3 [Capsicum annuum]|uniref:glycine-rich cell wall structural protein 2-like isoform X3 n=1 Tax=Capsicum annuum TaxID=4072 RepID=UPI001FB12A7D|nr:glycine-rich cell wall structural protein 2-like isoform X3 [Capsicum annuum]